MNEQQKQVIRDAVAAAYPGDNAEFVRQLRSGEQDDGPLMRSGFAAGRAILASVGAAATA